MSEASVLRAGPNEALTLPRGGAQYPSVALSAGRARSYEGELAVDSPARPSRPRRSRTLRREAQLAYAILGPSLLVLVCLVAYPFGSAIYLSTQDKMVGAPGTFNTHVIPKMVQRVLVENWEPAKALEEGHKKVVEIYARHEKA